MKPCVDHGQRGDEHGYGRVVVAGVRVPIHRFLYCVANGVELDAVGEQLTLHACDNPRCIEPSHLRLGTHDENMADMSQRRRHRNSTLSPAAVADIRANCKPGKVGDHQTNPAGLRAFAKKYGINHRSVRNVLAGVSYRHE